MRGLEGRPSEGNYGDVGVRGRLSGSRVPSRNTGRGVHLLGEPKGSKPVGVRKLTVRSLVRGEARGLKGPAVKGMRLEAGRSSLGQGEAERKLGGGLKGC